MKKEINKEIMQKLEKLEEADGYLVMVTALKGDKLFHYQSHENFKVGDFMPTLEEYSRLFQPLVSGKSSLKVDVEVKPKEKIIDAEIIEDEKPVNPL